MASQAGSRYVESYEPTQEYGGAKRSQRDMIEELSMRLSAPREYNGGLSSGDSIMVETMRKSRSRPHDQDRLDELAAPSKKGSTCRAWGCPPPDPLAPPAGSVDFALTWMPKRASKLAVKGRGMGAAQLDHLLSRLAAPRQSPPMGGTLSTGEQIVINSQAGLNSKVKDVCLRTLTARLCNPRELPDSSANPPSGEGVMLEALNRRPKRAVNFEHLNRIARSNKRGASARSWGAMLPSSET